jgi:hypothetical protein
VLLLSNLSPVLLLLLLQIEVKEIGGQNCIVLQQDASLGRCVHAPGPTPWLAYMCERAMLCAVQLWALWTSINSSDSLRSDYPLL